MSGEVIQEPIARAMNARVSDLLEVGRVYARADLKTILATNDATLNTGVFQPAGFDSILLFVTEKKTSDRTPYLDRLDGEVLRWQGQSSGRSDDKIVKHGVRDVELLLFYRVKKNQYPHHGFKYEGAFAYVTHGGALPANFILRRLGEYVDEAELEAELEAQAGANNVFDPESIEDARRKKLASIVVRQGQPAFRKTLLEAYEGRCALSGCDVEEVLEAAHICGYMGEQTNDVRNGLLLRADLHTLYDRDLFAIEPVSHRLHIAQELTNSEYRWLTQCSLRLPNRMADRPSDAALHVHFARVQETWKNKRNGSLALA